MKNVIIFHGYGETPNSYWYPYLTKELKKKKYSVNIPSLPNTNNPKLDEQLEFALKNLEFTENTILIGHSSGCPLILAILENISSTIKQVIFVAGYSTPLRVGTDDTKNIKNNFDWETIKKHSKDFVFINSDNDPWGADDKQGKYMQEKLGGKLIINHEGHMGSDSFKQPYKKFPFLLEVIK